MITHTTLNRNTRDFPGGPVVKTLSSNAGARVLSLVKITCRGVWPKML